MCSLSSSFAASPVDSSSSTLWIFGYGSLCWNPGFRYRNSCMGYVKGYSRKFWQGSQSHRGTANQPGRVVTLIKDDDAIVWGRAFEIASESSTAFEYLQTRECTRGGYVSELVTFHPIGGEYDVPIRALTFIAHSGNCMWLGEAPLTDISKQIVRCKGASGHNAEYMLKLAEYVRENIPEDEDRELFRLEELVLQQLKNANLSLDDVMMTTLSTASAAEPSIRSTPAESPSSSHNDFARRVPDKKLRCVNI